MTNSSPLLSHGLPHHSSRNLLHGTGDLVFNQSRLVSGLGRGREAPAAQGLGFRRRGGGNGAGAAAAVAADSAAVALVCGCHYTRVFGRRNNHFPLGH